MPLAHAPLFMVGLSGPELTQEEREAISALGLRHFILFRRNLVARDQVQALLTELGRLAPAGLRAVDQEGGPVARLRPPLFPALAAPLALAGEPNPEEAVSRQAALCARELRALGFNLNLAPVLDLAGPEAPAFLRGRTFGDDPDLVARLGRLYVRTVLSEGLWCCAKHFPGLSGAELDPHQELPAREDLLPGALVPFRAAVEAGVPCVMTTHLLVRALDRVPATFSQRTVALLRRELGFGGLVLSDDLFMGAVTGRHSLAEAARRALEAGHDLVLLCQEFEEAVRAVEALAGAFDRPPLRDHLAESLARQERLLSRLP